MGNEKIWVYVKTLCDLGSNPLHRWFSNGVIFFLPDDICQRPQTFCLSQLGGWLGGEGFLLASGG